MAARVVLITLESLSADECGAGGAPEARTPHLDRLARHGWQARYATSPAATSRTGLATLLTGLRPREHGLTRDEFALTAKRTLPQTLTARGIRTAVFAGTAAADARHGLTRGFSRREEPFRPGTDRVGEPWNEPGEADAAALARGLETWWREADEDAHTPSFAWVHLAGRTSGTSERTDGALETILRAVGEGGAPLVIVTSPAVPDAGRPIPWIVAGPEVPRGVRAAPASLEDATAVLAAAFAGAEPFARALAGAPQDSPDDAWSAPHVAAVPPLARPARDALVRARELDRAGDLESARQAYAEACRVEPRLVGARMRLAAIDRALGHPREAAEDARDVLAAVPNHPEAEVLLARLLAAERNPDQAADLVRDVLRVAPGHAGALAARAEIETLRGNPTAAVRDLRVALAAVGSRSDELVAIAGELSRVGLHPEAVTTARRALETGDRSPPARFALAFALSGAERYAESVDEYAALITDHPEYLPPYRNLGALMARDGELERAIRLWESGLRIHPDDPGLRANVEEARRALGLGTLGGDP